MEWCATEYLTAHLAVLNALLAGVGERDERVRIRRDLRNCGFEGIMGRKLRKASREYYPGLHGELQRWCWDGHRDGWRVLDVARGFGEVEEKPREERQRGEVDVT